MKVTKAVTTKPVATCPMAKLAMPTMAMMATAPQARSPNTLVMLSSSRCNGERVRLVAVTMSAIRPISVCSPVAVTTNVAVPRVTSVF